MTIMIRFYDRLPNFTPDYNREHHGTIQGTTASEVWRKFTEWKRNFDLARYTIPEIFGMYD